MHEGIELLIIGGGSAAFSAANEALRLGARVVLCNKGLPLGGTCPNVGCVPSKTMIRAAEAVHQGRHTGFSGLRLESELVSFADVVEQREALIENLVRTNYIDRVPDLENFRLVEAEARFLDARTVEAGGERFQPDRILVATGTSPAIPDIPGLRAAEPLTSETAFALRELPEEMVVLGGGYIALECAQMFMRFGTRVTLLQRSDHVLSDQEAYIGEGLAGHLRSEGMDLRCGIRLAEVEKEHGRIRLEARSDGEATSLTTSHLLAALGRDANLEGLGIEAAGLTTTGGGFLSVDKHLRTIVPHIFGAGDVIGDPQFVYTASYEGELAARNAVLGTEQQVDYRGLPWVIFTDPQVAGVGPDEAEARTLGHEVDTATLPATRWPRLRTAFDTRGFLKLIRDRATDQLLGARAVVPEGGELVSELSTIIRHRIPLKEVANSFHPYLTLTEGIQRAAQKFYA